MLADTHAALVSRFRELELACARVPDAIENAEEAAVATDFIAQCQAHIKTTEAIHKQEKEPFLKASRAVDAFFKRRCDKLTAALTPTVSRLKHYRNRLAEAERQRHRERQRASEEAAAHAAAEAAQHCAEAARLALQDRHRAAEHQR
jgi:hypothetical protein